MKVTAGPGKASLDGVLTYRDGGKDVPLAGVPIRVAVTALAGGKGSSLPDTSVTTGAKGMFNVTLATKSGVKYGAVAQYGGSVRYQAAVSTPVAFSGQSDCLRTPMRRGEFHYRWEWRLAAGPDALWPLVADTDRFNRDAGLPPVEQVGGEPRGLARRLRLRRLGVAVEWEEEPFEWVRPERFGVVRRYTRGPVAELRTTAELTPLPEGGTLLLYEVFVRARTLLGVLAIPIEIGQRSRRRFEQVFRRYDRLAEGRAIPTEQPRLAPGARERLAACRDVLVAQRAAPDLVDLLVETVEQGDDGTVFRLRPYALAKTWGYPGRAVLELCLNATRAGLLELSWDLLCPSCLGMAAGSPTLAAVDAQVHCESCRIDFNAEFDRSVELTFHPSPAVREAAVQRFCVGGPQTTPHVAVQQLLAGGERRILSVALEPGHYRSCLRGLPESRQIVVEAGGKTDLELENPTGTEQVFMLERTAWRDDAVTAADVTALQLFRDLFSSEALRPGERMIVGSLTIVFTDLRGSTRFYREVGDAPAFASVMDHLDVLRAAVAGEGGALVKTMGDAIMAVFQRPAPALRALLGAQRTLVGGALALKVGIHSGPCIAVTQNDRLDYFGSTVNAAARLVDLSTGEDVVVSESVRSDPEVAELLGDLLVRPLDATLKGFDDERFELYRLVPAAGR